MLETWITLLVCVLTIIGNIAISIIQNRKNITLVEYRLKALEEKVASHNNLNERVVKLEQSTADIKEMLKK